jgi:membrane-associated protein
MFGIDVAQVVSTLSYPGIFGIVYAETAFLVGFFLPGDTLLIGAGLLSAGEKAILSLPIVIPTIISAAILGDTTAFFLGKRFGPALFNRPQSRLFKPEYVTQARGFFDKYGSLTLTIAKFIPVVRAFAPTMAGASGMPYPKFLFFSALGAILWGGGLTSLAYYVGGFIPPDILEKYVLVGVGVVLLIAVAVSLFTVITGRRVH